MELDLDSPTQYRILCIDPGTETLGVSVLGYDVETNVPGVIAGITLHAERLARRNLVSFLHGDRFARNMALFRALVELCEEYQIHSAVIESPWLGKFAETFAALTECCFICKQAVYTYDPTIVLHKVDPPTAKLAVGAVTTKEDRKGPVRDAVLALGLSCSKDFDMLEFSEHVIDSIAVGYWYYRIHQGNPVITEARAKKARKKRKPKNAAEPVTTPVPSRRRSRRRRKKSRRNHAS